MGFLDMIRDGAFRQFGGGRIGDGDGTPLVAVNPSKLDVSVAAGAHASLVILHTEAGETAAEIGLEEGASLTIDDIYLAAAFSAVHIRQQGGSSCRLTSVELQGANADYDIDLDGAGASFDADGVFVGAGTDHCVFDLTTRHNVADCTSSSLVKGVVSGRATGEFRGHVYVAPDAQRTDACQQSRNIELGGDAHIVTKPQLEIYADDVKCSHGATVGQIDDDAVLYMRQRGLSEADARRLQIEGFVSDIVGRCSAGETLCGALDEAVRSKLEEL